MGKFFMSLKYLSKLLIKNFYKNLNFKSSSKNFRTLMYHSIVKENLNKIIEIFGN